MKKLIYFVCFGERYKNFLNKCLYSLFNKGSYDGEVIIITHFKETDFFNYEKLNVINVKTENDNITYYRNAKPKIHELVDLKNYDFVLYLDCDILINTNKINNLIKEWSLNPNKIFIQKDIISIKRNKPYCGSDVLSLEERQRHGDKAFNAGIIGASGFLFEKLCIMWNNKNKEHNYEKDDQGNLVFVIIKNFLDNIVYTNDTTITNRKNDEYRTETILHFLTKSERAFYSYFDKYIKE
jgi:hypothetical protein